MLDVYCSALRPRPILKWGADTGMVLTSRDCKIYIGIQFCGGDAKNHVFLLYPYEYHHEAHAHLPGT
ncbi:hypothetical protein ES703_34444 [subsurface metagenome]